MGTNTPKGTEEIGVEPVTPVATPPSDDAKPASTAKTRPGMLTNVIWNYGVFLMTAVVGFFMAPFVVHSLGNDLYGTWVLLGSLVGYLGLLDLGVRGAVTRFIAHRHAAADHDASSRYISAGLFVFSIVSAVTLLGGAAIALGLEEVFQLSPDSLQAARIAVVISALTMVSALIGGVFGGVVVGMERFDLNGALEMGLLVLRTLAVILVLKAGYGIVALATVHLVGGLVTLGANVLLSRWLYPELMFSLRRWRRSDLREMVDFSVSSTLLRGAGMIIRQMDAIVIGIFHPVALIAYFAVASNLLDYAISVLRAISFAITPRISALQGGDEVADIRRIPLLSGRLASFVLLPIVVTFLVRGSSFIGLWMGDEYSAPSGAVLWILAVSLWFSGGRAVLTAAFLGLNKHRELLLPTGVEAALNLGLSLLWVGQYGIVGVAWGTTIPIILVNLVWLPRIYVRVLEVSLRAVYTNLLIRPTLAIVPFAIGSVFLERAFPAGSLIIFFAQVAMIMPLALLGIWFFGLKPHERDVFHTRLLGALDGGGPRS